MALAAPTQVTRGKNHDANGIRYDALSVIPFDLVTLATSSATTAVAASLPLPVTMKIYGLSLVASSVTNGVTFVNVAMGTVAEAGEAQPDNTEAGQVPPTPAINGNTVFASLGAPLDQQVTLAANVPQTLLVPSPCFDFVWPQNALMTLRIAAGTTVVGTLKAALLVKAYDPVPWRPSSIQGAVAPGYAFNPPNDIR